MDDLPVLHALSVKGFASAEAIGGFCGVPAATVAATLERLAAGGHVRHRDRLDVWSLTDTGRARHRDLLAPEAAGIDGAEALAASYQRFLVCDRSFKRLCTEWQHQGRSANRERQLRDLQADLVDALAPAVTLLPRLARHHERLAAACDRVLAGDDAALARPLTDSYHDVWMELHEDLIQTLGVDRPSV